MAINPGEEAKMQMFIWNNIFFSLGFDVKDHYKDLGGDAAAFVAPRNDLQGVKVSSFSQVLWLLLIFCQFCDYHRNMLYLFITYVRKIFNYYEYDLWETVNVKELFMVFVAFKVQNFCNFLTVVSLSFTSIWLSVPFYYFWLLAGVQCCGPGGSVHPGNGGAGLQGIQGHRTVNHSRWQPRPQTRVLQYFNMEIRCSVLNIVVDAGSGSEDPYNFANPRIHMFYHQKWRLH